MMSISKLSIVNANTKVTRTMKDLEFEWVILVKVDWLEFRLNIYVLDNFNSHAILNWVSNS